MDIVKWLRQFKLSTSDSNYNALIVNAKTEEAADEIERLRQQNAELRELLQNWMGCCFVDEKNNNISFGMGVKKVWSETREAIAKATGGE